MDYVFTLTSISIQAEARNVENEYIRLLVQIGYEVYSPVTYLEWREQ